MLLNDSKGTLGFCSTLGWVGYVNLNLSITKNTLGLFISGVIGYVVTDNEYCVQFEHLQFCLFLISVSFNCNILIFSCLWFTPFPFSLTKTWLPWKPLRGGEGVFREQGVCCSQLVTPFPPQQSRLCCPELLAWRTVGPQCCSVRGLCRAGWRVHIKKWRNQFKLEWGCGGSVWFRGSLWLLLFRTLLPGNDVLPWCAVWIFL